MLKKMVYRWKSLKSRCGRSDVKNGDKNDNIIGTYGNVKAHPSEKKTMTHKLC